MSKTDKIYIALLLLVVAAGIGTREYQSHRIDAFNPDGHYLDSILKEKGWPKESIIHLPITSDTATPETHRDYDSSVKAQEAEDSATPAKGFSATDDGYRGVSKKSGAIQKLISRKLKAQDSAFRWGPGRVTNIWIDHVPIDSVAKANYKRGMRQ